jgi:hypothetical protein
MFHQFDSDTAIPLENIPVDQNRISVPGPVDKPTKSCRQASILLAKGTYRISTSSSSWVDSPYDDLFAAGTVDVTDVTRGAADTTDPVKIMCPSVISGLDANECYITDFTPIPVFQDCSAITLTQSGTVAKGNVITVTATDSSGNVGDPCEMTITGDDSLCDKCTSDDDKIFPGQCGCNTIDTDTDSDGTADCNDSCPIDPLKIIPGACGCGIPDTDTDGDGILDCFDFCPNDKDKNLEGSCGPPPIPLGRLCDYAILAKSGISTVATSTVNGNIGVSPIAATAITGFGLALDGGGQFSTASQVNGKAYAADYGFATETGLTAAVLAMQNAYTAAAGRKTTETLLGTDVLSGRTLTFGVYTITAAINIYDDLTLQGGPDDVFIFQSTGVLTLAADKKVILSGGVQAKNVFWQIAGNVVIEARASMQGIIFCFTNVDFITGSSLQGSIYSQTAVSLGMATITQVDTCPAVIIPPAPPGPNQPPIALGSLCNYAILAQSGISTVTTSSVNGNIGVSPIAATAITGFGLALDGGRQYSTASQVNGKAYAADYGFTTAADLTVAVLDMQTAYTEAASRTTIDPARFELLGGSIGGQTLTPGVYTFTTAITIYSDITFQGDADDVFIIQTSGVLSLAVGVQVVLSGGVQAQNIFWQVAGNVAIGANALMQGIILCKTDVVFVTGSSLQGSIYAQTAVALQKATITQAQTCSGVIAPPAIIAPPGASLPPVDLGPSLCNYAILAETGISTVTTSTVNGNIGVSPIDAGAITNFDLSLALGGQYSTASQVNGKAYAADYGGETAADLTVAVLAMQTAYTDAAGRKTTETLQGTALGGRILKAGVYTTTAAINIDSDLTFDGIADDVFIIQTTGVLTLAANKKVILSGGAQAQNIFWQVAGNVAIETGAAMQGIILCKTNVVFVTGSTLIGSIYAQTEVALQMATITQAGTCAPVIPPPVIIAPQQSGVDLKKACNYAILAETGISSVATSTVTGNIAVSPIAATAITGFGLALDGGGQFSTASQVVGRSYAADYGGDTAADLTVAVLDMQTAYTDAASRTTPDPKRINLLDGSIGGQTLTPGVYAFTTAITIYSDLTLEGGVDDVFIIQTTGVFTLAVDVKIILSGGVQAKNVFWQVAGNAAIGAQAHMEGILLVKTDVVFITGSSLNGSILAQTAVALQMASITRTADICTTTIVAQTRS